eukprot:CAMPEP_0185825586 /NCGR_PEP_ID=MMETSP1322-20130828/31120_1 /TAXON_ID=265543 /ORGANISM="Minutocellus polymorphus, Strain RCC2270" /LENGTH=623 /DNA_ID=CAMNT_0028523309 /DNA_START=47 /DNA_END=1918 /DNA_ORIENTATION=+
MKIPAVAVSMALFGSVSAFVTRQSSSVGRSVARSLVASQRPVVGAGTAFGTMQSRSVSTTAPTALSMSKDDKKNPFETWSFDSHCKSMEWSPLSEAELVVSGEFDEGSDADLVIVGVAAPASDDEDEDSSSDDKEEEPPVLTGAAKALDDKLGGALSDLMAENAKAFKNGAGVGSTTPTLRVATAGSKAKRYVLVGLGKDGKDWEDGDVTKIGNAIASKCSAEKKVGAASILLSGKVGDDSAALSDISTAFYSTLYADNRYRTGAKKETPAEDLKTVTISIEGGVSDQSSADAAIAAGKSLTTGVSLCRDIVNAPHNVLNSESLAETAKRIAKESGGNISCKILGKKECEARGMGSFLGVARGSETDPQFIHLTYKPKSGEVNKKVAVVGKGLLFDTGGYNIKTAMMELMKFDCGGSAATLGAARAVGELAPEGVEAHFIVAACENMINERAVVPSDILTASNGKTIEIINTDAEGRLTLADALVYADREVGAESIIEMSTLTGAMMVSLGKEICGFFTTDDALAKELEDASKKTGDKSWRMPMAKEYNDQLKSKIADLTNCGTRYGGAITAALFLENFVSKKKPFAHIDIAGPVWNDKSGATGFGAKLAVEWISRQGQAKKE